MAGIITKTMIEQGEKALVDLGFEHFIILTPPDDDLKLSATFHQMKSGETVNVLINFLVQAIDHELAANPDYSKSYSKIFTDFKLKFKELVADVNFKVEKYNEKNNKEK